MLHVQKLFTAVILVSSAVYCTLLTRQVYIMTRTCSVLTRSIWKTISPHGTCVNQSVKHQTYAALQNTHEMTQACMHGPAFTAPDIQQREVKVNQEADRDSSTQTSAPSQRQMVSQSGRPAASTALRLPCHPSVPPLDLHLGTHGRWHLANVTPLFPAKINYVFITLALWGS